MHRVCNNYNFLLCFILKTSGSRCVHCSQLFFRVPGPNIHLKPKKLDRSGMYTSGDTKGQV